MLINIVTNDYETQTPTQTQNSFFSKPHINTKKIDEQRNLIDPVYYLMITLALQKERKIKDVLDS